MINELVYWRPLHSIGLEQLHLVEDAHGVRADSVVLGCEQANPYRLEYQLRMDHTWQVRECVLRLVHLDGQPEQTLRLSSDGRGHWTDGAGTGCTSLDGCLDLDISCTPFTNTLPIRRLRLPPGESAELQVVYLAMPELSCRPVRQRYTCIRRTASGWRYRYEALDGQTTFDLLVDEQGLVVDYPGIWQRIESASPVDGFPQSAVVLDGLLAAGPQPDLAEQLHLFGQFVGDWEAEWTGYPADTSERQTGTGEIHFAWVLDGRAIQDVWIFPSRHEQRQGQPLEEWGSTLRLYDPKLKRWTICWATPLNAAIRLMTARAVGEEIWVEGSNLKGQLLRWIFSQITPHSFHWRNVVSEDDGQTWRLQEELEARRMTQRSA
jgi:uncharacterized protein